MSKTTTDTGTAHEPAELTEQDLDAVAGGFSASDAATLNMMNYLMGTLHLPPRPPPWD